MRKILIASHGRVASGVKSAIKILMGNADAVTAVDCYLDESDFTPQIEEFIASIGLEDEGIIFTDLLGGSVCNKVMTLHPEDHGVPHVTGFNLITVIECLLSSDPLTPENLDKIVSAGSQQMRRVVIEQADDSEDDAEFFS